MEEDKIIKDKLRKSSKRDIIDYCLIGFVFVMIFVPAIFKVVFYDSSIKITTRDVVYLTLTCRKSSIVGESNISTLIVNNYKDSIIQKSTVTYGYNKDNEENVPDVGMILALNLGNKIEKKQNDNGYTFSFDFVKNRDLLKIEDLKKFSMSAPTATKEYAEQGYFCERSSEIVTEEVNDEEEDLSYYINSDSKTSDDNKTNNDSKTNDEEIGDVTNNNDSEDKELVCSKTIVTDEKEESVVIENKYKNGKINNSTITYVYDKENKENSNGMSIFPLTLDNNVEKKENDNGHTFIINFENNDDLLLVDELKKFSLSIDEFYKEFTSDGFTCEQKNNVGDDESENQ